MLDFNKLIKLTESEDVEEGAELPKIQLHKWLVLGQTEYLCEYGTLSDGHEKFTDAQKYAQALREWYYLALNMKSCRANAKMAMADYIEANHALDSAKTAAEIFRAEGRKELAEAKIQSHLTTAEDQMRMIKFYKRKCSELGPSVEAQYPGGIEQAEIDNWKSIFEYRALKGDTHVSNIPLPPLEKAKMGLEFKNIEAIAPLIVENKEKFLTIANEDPQKLQKFVRAIEKNTLAIGN